jgi:uncharacterized membrane protein YdbT with pleckstrin-like domain
MPEVLDRFRSSTWGWVCGTAVGWLFGLTMLAGGILTLLDKLGGVTLVWPAISPILTIAGPVVIIVKYIQNLGVTYELTADRLILRRGIFIKSIDEIELYRVKNVRMDFTLMNQLVGIGTISVDSSDETTKDGPLVMPYIERAAERREELRTLVDTARQKRRVRELDVASDLL